MSIDRLDTMLQMQLSLQVNNFRKDPRELRGAELTNFILWNAFALTDEIHEAMQEVGWKPWASSKHVNEDLFMGEMVDAWHFFMNMLLAAFPHKSTEEIMTDFFNAYLNKNQVNKDRQANGYDGVSSKCSICGRELDKAGVCPKESSHESR